MKVLLVVLAVLLLLALLLCIPVTLTVCTDPKPLVRVRFLFLRLTLYPRPPRKAKRGKRPPAPKEETGKEKKLQTEELLRLLRAAGDLLAELPRPLRRLLRAVKIVRLRLQIKVCQEDAAQTAIRYGSLCAAFYTAWGLLASLVRVRRKGVHVELWPDFTFGEEYVKLDAVCRIGLYGALGAGLQLGFGFLRRQLRRARAGEGPAVTPVK